MADKMRMALAAPVAQAGARRGAASLPARPRGREGAPSPAGAERACERSRPRSGLDGERGRGRLSGWEAVPRRPLGLVDGNGQRMVLLWCQDRKESQNNG
jgi:hypothetical protein